ncbi:CoA pyrophosphatase [Aestuariibacter salexigens]|uniref:CoA pyrophosphatase n=1 Tax=Aestuariibacter salexigens TaxID=226010 RepID=UPI00041B4E21|nr:CoA pyrophosphatase [Aestuariibacter salexigens]
MDKNLFIQRFHHLRLVRQEDDFPLSKPGRPAAVLFPIVDRLEQLTVLFTRRSSHLKNHAGQVSFPGGKQEPDDEDLLATALRETREEIGLADAHIEVIGQLPRFRTISYFEVVPYIGIVTPPFELTLDRNEVEEVFEVPLAYLLDMNNHHIQWFTRHGKQRPVYFIPWNDLHIWGATASFVRNLAYHFNEDIN